MLRSSSFIPQRILSLFCHLLFGVVADNSVAVQAFESELKKYMAIEQEISQVAPMHNIGSLALETQPLKYSLKSEAASWKAQYAKNLHKQGSEELKAFDQYMRDTTLKLNRKVEDLEDVRFIMGVLKEVTYSPALSCMQALD